MNRPTVGIYGLTGCAGDQLVILNCEDRLREIAGLVDIVDFPMASSQRDRTSRLDIAFVEGSVMSARDETLLHGIRERSDVLVAIGTCALWGGLPEIGPGPEWASRRAMMVRSEAIFSRAVLRPSSSIHSRAASRSSSVISRSR